MESFEWIDATSVEQAATLLAEADGNGNVIANGGMDLLALCIPTPVSLDGPVSVSRPRPVTWSNCPASPQTVACQLRASSRWRTAWSKACSRASRREYGPGE